jgi:DNA-binding transcriptional MerR regulator
MRLPETTGDRSGDPMRAADLPSKLFFRIGEVASLVGVEPHVLRYWEREFRSIRPTKSAKGQRVYSRKDVENLLRVRDLLYRDGFTIAGAKKRLQRALAPSDDGVTALAAQASLFAEPERERERDDDFANASDVSPEAGEPGEAELEGHHAHARNAHEDSDSHDDLDLSPADPESGPRESAIDPMREKLTALRAEVEGFLHELESDRGERIERA